MKIIHRDLRKGEIKVKIENLDDLWYLSNIIESSDIIKGRTFRKIKIGDNTQRKTDVVRKAIFISIKVEKVDFGSQKDTLRVSGTVEEEIEDVPKGSHHTFNLEENSIFMIIKERWLRFQLDKLKEASEDKGAKIMVVVLDRDEADFALMKKYGFEMLNALKGDVKKKGMDEGKGAKVDFYAEVIKTIEEYIERYKISKVVLGSPGFWKDEFMKKVDDELKKKILLATCSTTGTAGINEVLKRDEVKTALHEERASKEMHLVEELLSEISKSGLAAYGGSEVNAAAESGAVKTLLITDSLIQGSREEGTYRKIERIMKLIDENKGDVIIVSSENDGGRKLNGLGGIGALLRYKMSY